MKPLKAPVILLVDDTESSRYVTARILRRAGMEVWEAASGAEALKKAAQKPDLVLLDVNLPDMSGFEVCHHLRTLPHGRTLPVLHLTASRVEMEDHIKGLRGGADAYLVHPVDEDLLLATVQTHLRLAEMERKLAESEMRYRRLADNSKDLICRFELFPEPHFSYVSPAAIRILGYTPDEHYANPSLRWEIILPEDRPMLQALLEGRTVPGQPVLLRWRHKNGEMVWTESLATVYHDDAGQVLAVESITRDITERKRAEMEREQLIRDLQKALEEIKTLQGILTVCAGCKKNPQ